jgi:hypothetical protein
MSLKSEYRSAQRERIVIRLQGVPKANTAARSATDSYKLGRAHH